MLAFLERERGLTAGWSEEILNRRSGLLGLSGISSDLREVLKAADAGVPRAVAAVTAYCYRVRKAIGACVAVLGGLDALVFTAGVGQGSDRIRAMVLEGSGILGIRLDGQRNHSARGFDEICRISADDPPVAVLVVPIDEERLMAGEALGAVGRPPD